jgi:hypothetical protein
MKLKRGKNDRDVCSTKMIGMFVAPKNETKQCGKQ